MFTPVKEIEKGLFEKLKEKFAYKSVMQAPKVEKVVVAVGTGSFKDPNKKDVVIDRLARITGQKPKYNKARKSIATFKLREGQTIGYQVTLRGERAYAFIDKLIHVALPRTRDFRGLSPDAVDEQGNFTIGIKEHTIFPETSDEELKDIFGLGVTIVTSAKGKDEALEYLKGLGFPFKKTDNG